MLIGRQGALCGNINTVSGKVYISEHAVVISDNELSNIGYLEQLLIKLHLNQYSESSAQPGLSVDKLKRIAVITPSISEQTAIGNFFRTLDDSIAMQKRKCEGLRKLKTAYLQQMFPQNGERVPRVRFEGFSGDWQVSRLDEVFVPSVPNNTLSRAALTYDDGEVRNIHYGDVLMKFGAFVDSTDKMIPFIANAKVSDFRSQLLQDGDIVFADTAEDEMVGKAVEVTNTNSANIVSGLHTYVYRPQRKTSPCFFGYYLNSQSYRRQLLKLMQGIKVLSINRSSLSKTLVSYPASLDEQTEIGRIFRTIDEQITAQAHKLEQLMKLKSAYLQKMFI